jgi:hypothetical protein
MLVLRKLELEANEFNLLSFAHFELAYVALGGYRSFCYSWLITNLVTKFFMSILPPIPRHRPISDTAKKMHVKHTPIFV